MTGRHASEYDAEQTDLYERTLVTLIGNVGPWSDRLYLVGGLVPRYLVEGEQGRVQAHVGTNDLDIAVRLALKPDDHEAYSTLTQNLKKSGFERSRDSFRWIRAEGGQVLEFLSERDDVAAGSSFPLRVEGVGSEMSALCTRGVLTATEDFVVRKIRVERLGGGGISEVEVRIANILPFVALKVMAFQDRHKNKDAYDIVFTLQNMAGGPRSIGERTRSSIVAGHRFVTEAVQMLGARFSDPSADGPTAYAQFRRFSGTVSEQRELRLIAVKTVTEFVSGFNGSG